MNLRPSGRNWLPLAGSFAAWMGIAAMGADPVRPTAADTPAIFAPTRVIDLRVMGRRLEEGPRTIRLVQGERALLRWSTDEGVLLHLHGYDLEVALEPGVRTAMPFEAHLVGRFPISAHRFGPATGKAAAANHRHEPALLYLEVHPE